MDQILHGRRIPHLKDSHHSPSYWPHHLALSQHSHTTGTVGQGAPRLAHGSCVARLGSGYSKTCRWHCLSVEGLQSNQSQFIEESSLNLVLIPEKTQPGLLKCHLESCLRYFTVVLGCNCKPIHYETYTFEVVVSFNWAIHLTARE